MAEKFKFEFDQLLIRWSIICAVLGLTVSVLSALIGGASWLSILFKPIGFALLLALFALAVYYILKLVSPELVETINSVIFAGGGAESDLDIGNVDNEDVINEEFATSDISEVSDGLNSPTFGGKANQVAKEGEILVEGVAIKNEPKIMAEAIRQVLDQDE